MINEKLKNALLELRENAKKGYEELRPLMTNFSTIAAYNFATVLQSSTLMNYTIDDYNDERDDFDNNNYLIKSDILRGVQVPFYLFAMFVSDELGVMEAVGSWHLFNCSLESLKYVEESLFDAFKGWLEKHFIIAFSELFDENNNLRPSLINALDKKFYSTNDVSSYFASSNPNANNNKFRLLKSYWYNIFANENYWTAMLKVLIDPEQKNDSYEKIAFLSKWFTEAAKNYFDKEFSNVAQPLVDESEKFAILVEKTKSLLLDKKSIVRDYKMNLLIIYYRCNKPADFRLEALLSLIQSNDEISIVYAHKLWVAIVSHYEYEAGLDKPIAGTEIPKLEIPAYEPQPTDIKTALSNINMGKFIFYTILETLALGTLFCFLLAIISVPIVSVPLFLSLLFHSVDFLVIMISFTLIIAALYVGITDVFLNISATKIQNKFSQKLYEDLKNIATGDYFYKEPNVNSSLLSPTTISLQSSDNANQDNAEMGTEQEQVSLLSCRNGP
jgi:hypothetical protein